MDSLESAFDVNSTKEIESFHAWGTDTEESIDFMSHLSKMQKYSNNKFIHFLKKN